MNRLLLARTATLAGYFGLITLLLAWQLWLSPSTLPTGLVLAVLIGPWRRWRSCWPAASISAHSLMSASRAE